MRPLSRREVRDIWSTVARNRRRDGDTAGAARAARNARIISGDDRTRHDLPGIPGRGRVFTPVKARTEDDAAAS